MSSHNSQVSREDCSVCLGSGSADEVGLWSIYIPDNSLVRLTGHEPKSASVRPDKPDI